MQVYPSLFSNHVERENASVIRVAVARFLKLRGVNGAVADFGLFGAIRYSLLTACAWQREPLPDQVFEQTCLAAATSGLDAPSPCVSGSALVRPRMSE